MCMYYFSSDNSAEKLFAEMGTKDGASYDAMIQGLVKVLASTDIQLASSP